MLNLKIEYIKRKIKKIFISLIVFVMLFPNLIFAYQAIYDIDNANVIDGVKNAEDVYNYYYKQGKQYDPAKDGTIEEYISKNNLYDTPIYTDDGQFYYQRNDGQKIRNYSAKQLLMLYLYTGQTIDTNRMLTANIDATLSDVETAFDQSNIFLDNVNEKDYIKILSKKDGREKVQSVASQINQGQGITSNYDWQDNQNVLKELKEEDLNAGDSILGGTNSEDAGSIKSISTTLVDQKTLNYTDDEKYIIEHYYDEDEGENKYFLSAIAEGLKDALLSGLSSLLLAIADGILEIMQSLMMPGNLKAIDKRGYNNENLNFYRKFAEDACLLFDNKKTYSLTKSNYTLEDANAINDYKGGGDLVTQLTTGNRYTTVDVPRIQFGVAAILTNNVPSLDVDFFNSNIRVVKYDSIEEYSELVKEVYLDKTSKDNNEMPEEVQERVEDLWLEVTKNRDKSIMNIIRPVVAKWYIAFRNLTISALLVVLVYIGIRMVISATAMEKLKYKQMLFSWISAVLIVFSMAIIMSLAVKAVDSIVKTIGSGVYSASEGDVLLNKTRTKIAIYATRNDRASQFGLSAVYLCIIVAAVYYTMVYIKRFIFLAVLTAISPLVALTFPIDKVGDGKAQAFGTWCTEYVMQLLIQPIQLISYIVFIETSLSLAETGDVAGIIFALVAITYLRKSDEFLKNLFKVSVILQSEGTDDVDRVAGSFSQMIIATEGALNNFMGYKEMEYNVANEEVARERKRQKLQAIANDPMGGPRSKYVLPDEPPMSQKQPQANPTSNMNPGDISRVVLNQKPEASKEGTYNNNGLNDKIKQIEILLESDKIEANNPTSNKEKTVRVLGRKDKCGNTSYSILGEDIVITKLGNMKEVEKIYQKEFGSKWKEKFLKDIYAMKGKEANTVIRLQKETGVESLSKVATVFNTSEFLSDLPDEEIGIILTGAKSIAGRYTSNKKLIARNVPEELSSIKEFEENISKKDIKNIKGVTSTKEGTTSNKAIKNTKTNTKTNTNNRELPIAKHPEITKSIPTKVGKNSEKNFKKSAIELLSEIQWSEDEKLESVSIKVKTKNGKYKKYQLYVPHEIAVELKRAIRRSKDRTKQRKPIVPKGQERKTQDEKPENPESNSNTVRIANKGFATQKPNLEIKEKKGITKLGNVDFSDILNNNLDNNTLDNNKNGEI